MTHDHHHDGDDTMGPDAVAALVGAHREFLAFLERRVGDRAMAEDILQDAFVRGLGKLDSVRKEESVIAWFYRVLRNAVIDHHRRRASSERKLEALARELEAQTPTDEVDNVVCKCIGELARTLKPEYAEALVRVELEGVAVKDYAVEAGITSNNAGVRVFRAREALKKQVKKSCGTCSKHGCLDCACQPQRH